ncbi:MAG: AMP-binding protein [Alphaproteobacteria bacterium]
MDLLLTAPDEGQRYRRIGLWRDITIFEQFEAQTKTRLDKVAAIDSQRQYTYGELLAYTRNIAGNLIAKGFKAGDVIAVQLPNRAELPLMHLAANRIGAVILPIHDSWHQAELPHLLKQGKAVATIVPHKYRDIDYPAILAGLRGELPNLRTIFTIGGAGGGTERFEDLLAPSNLDDAALQKYRPDPDAPACLMLSSGTTSMPKISVFSSNDLLALLIPFWHGIRLTSEDIAAALAPAGTGAIGYVYPILSPLLNGATTIILERWGEPAEAVELILKHRCTYATAVPAQLTQMLPELEKRKPADFAAFRLFSNAGAPLPYEIGRKVEDAMQCRIYVIYGATDGGVACSTDYDDPQEKRLTTVGKPLQGREVVLMDANGKPVPAGEPGEIYWRTPDKSYGYLNDPQATRSVFTADRFYKSGDLGTFDAEGYVKIIGRVKDMIIRGGRNISPRLIEEMVITHPSVTEVAVVAMPDRVMGERACAFVLLKPGAKLSFDEMIRFLRERRAPTWQMPERLEIVADFPRSAGGKVMKNKLTELVTDKLKAEGALV